MSSDVNMSAQRSQCRHKTKIVTGIKRREAVETIETSAAIRAHALLQQTPTPVMASLPQRIRQTPVSASIKQLVIPKDYKIYKISAAVQKPLLLVDSGTYNESDEKDNKIRLRHDSDFIRILSMNILWDNAG
ncbi:hypothetical protein GPALN_004531 [Globodera pallida]|nr:hypothetical protein GPALN_004531 [Globodera pallida]